jgi:hypothetical protein
MEKNSDSIKFLNFRDRHYKVIYQMVTIKNGSGGGRVTVLNTTFNNISVISWRSVLLVEETRENHRPVTSH